MSPRGGAALLLCAVAAAASVALAQESPPPGTSSLVFVFDTTGSMYDDLVQVREGAKKIYTTVREQRKQLVYNYVLVPFHDPEVGPVVSTTDEHYFQRKLQNLFVQGGGDCPEMAITGIKMALEEALPASFIYIFTDSRAKDYHLTEQVLNLIQQKQSQLVFVMTGDCGNRTHPGYTSFEQIASASSGQIFHLEKTDVEDVLNYVRVSVQTRKVNIEAVDRRSGGAHVTPIPVDLHLVELHVSLSGGEPRVQLFDPDGHSYDDFVGILGITDAFAGAVHNPKPGVWQLHTTANSKHSLRVTGIGAISFTQGFASRRLADFDKAHSRPLQDVSSYLMVNMTGLAEPGVVSEVSLVNATGEVLYTGQAVADDALHWLYSVGPIEPPAGFFFIKVTGRDDHGFDFQRYSLTAISAELEGAPRVYMQPQTAGFRLQSANLTCEVDSRAPYTLHWYKGDTAIAGPFFFKQSETVTHTLQELKYEDQGEYRCVVTSKVGNSNATTQLSAREPKPHIIAVRNVSVASGATAYLHCRTQSPTKASITWQRNGIPLQSSEHVRIYPNGTLVVLGATELDEGGFVCRLITRGGAAEAEIFLNVLQPPQVLVEPERLYFVAGGIFNISCAASGDPRPRVHWQRDGATVVPDGRFFVSYKYDLIVRTARPEDAGSYTCAASSDAGDASMSSHAHLATAPAVSVSSDKRMIGRGDRVVLRCDVTHGEPAPVITWFKAGREVTAFRYVRIEQGRLTIEGAQESDAGVYTCKATNLAGTGTGDVNIDVGSVPSIIPGPDTITATIERDATLPCRATGHPQPEIAWKRDGRTIDPVLEPRYHILPDGSLTIRDVRMGDQSRFICTATNRFGTQDAVRTVMVVGLISPVLGHVPPEQQLIEGDTLRLGCVVVVGTPKPALTWTKDGRPVRTNDNIRIENDGVALVVARGTAADEGGYTCTATNAAGNASVNVDVTVITKPSIADMADTVTVNLGEAISLPCVATGVPRPTVEWNKDAKPMLVATDRYSAQANGSLHVHKAVGTDAGLYTCRASNTAGEASRLVTVRVRLPPSMMADPSVYNVIDGGTVTMVCRAGGDPEPTVEWFHEDGLVTAEHSVNEDGSLTLAVAESHDRGRYKCVASNVVGTDAREVTLTVHTIPQITAETKTIYVVVNETATLPCPALAEPPPSRTWTFEDRKVFKGYSYGSELRFTGDGALEIERSQMQHDGRYTCFVSNLAGNDSITYQLVVQEPARIISDIAGTIDVALAFALEIPCRAIGTPQPTVAWKKDGFEIQPDALVSIDADGTLRMSKADLTHAGAYMCVAKNTAGSDERTTNVVVQEPPTILASTPADYSVTESAELRLTCRATGSPTPLIEWYRRGARLTDTDGMETRPDGSLVIANVASADHGAYVCRATNPAGRDEKVVKVTVIVPPEIPDQDKIIKETVLVGGAFSLYCPVFSTPIPEITWSMNDRPLPEGDGNVVLSEDHRRLHINKARVTDAGVYKCVARNAAGESSKTFELEVLVPPNLDESRWSRRVQVMQNDSVTFGCPVQGVPEPTVNWLANGQLLRPGQSLRGVTLADDKLTVSIGSAQLDHEGSYTCLAVNKAGSLDIDIALDVLAPPSLGADANVTVVTGDMIALHCKPRRRDTTTAGVQADDAAAAATISWLVDDNPLDVTPIGSIQAPLGGRRLFVQSATLAHAAVYSCIVRNSAGEARKDYRVTVLGQCRAGAQRSAGQCQLAMRRRPPAV